MCAASILQQLAQDWIHDLPYSSGDKDMTGFSSRLSNAKAVANAESAKRDAELRARFVVVPPGDEAKHITCPICKEAFKSEFNEEDEEWIWKNALKVDDKVCPSMIWPAKGDLNFMFVDISCNMSCGGFTYKWFVVSSFATGVRRQSLGNARCTIFACHTPPIRQG